MIPRSIPTPLNSLFFLFHAIDLLLDNSNSDKSRSSAAAIALRILPPEKTRGQNFFYVSAFVFASGKKQIIFNCRYEDCSSLLPDNCPPRDLSFLLSSYSAVQSFLLSALIVSALENSSMAARRKVVHNSDSAAADNREANDSSAVAAASTTATAS